MSETFAPPGAENWKALTGETREGVSKGHEEALDRFEGHTKVKGVEINIVWDEKSKCYFVSCNSDRERDMRENGCSPGEEEKYRNRVGNENQVFPSGVGWGFTADKRTMLGIEEEIISEARRTGDPNRVFRFIGELNKSARYEEQKEKKRIRLIDKSKALRSIDQAFDEVDEALRNNRGYLNGIQFDGAKIDRGFGDEFVRILNDLQIQIEKDESIRQDTWEKLARLGDRRFETHIGDKWKAKIKSVLASLSGDDYSETDEETDKRIEHAERFLSTKYK